MDTKLSVAINENKTSIQFDNHHGSITIFNNNDTKNSLDEACIYFLLKNDTIIAIGKKGLTALFEDSDFQKIIVITPPWDIELDYLETLFIEEAEKNGLVLKNIKQENRSIPVNSLKNVTKYKELLLLVLATFGYHFFQKQEKTAPPATKSKHAKARHRWSKEISQIEFFIDSRESKATVLWHKRNEMLLKAGATMMKEPALNKDGSLGFAARMGEKIRDDHKDKFKNFATTEDIVLKSVNEVGLFLYFGGTNSWLELVDVDGKSIDAWTKVEE